MRKRRSNRAQKDPVALAKHKMSLDARRLVEIIVEEERQGMQTMIDNARKRAYAKLVGEDQ